MQNSFEPGSNGNQPAFRPENLDFPRIFRIIGYIALALVVIGLLAALNWGGKFYTDYLWFSGLGYEPVLVKEVITKIWLYILAAAVFGLPAACCCGSASASPLSGPQHRVDPPCIWSGKPEIRESSGASGDNGGNGGREPGNDSEHPVMG
jgi:hypothetical protein